MSQPLSTLQHINGKAQDLMNWLFSGTQEGAEASALLYSCLIETTKANKREPYTFLRYIYEKLPLASSIEDYEALLPWNIPLEVLAGPALG